MNEPICEENTCKSITCLVWWLTQAVKYPNHVADRHRESGVYCAACWEIEQARQQTAGRVPA